MISVFLSIAAIIIALAAAKTILFIKNIGDKKLVYWFFFPRYSVIPSSRATRKYKEQQNKFSAILFIMFLIELAGCFIFEMYH
ncbi:MAG TPA: hypothetical protein VGI61_09055 [Parafilimonas sp.]